MSNSDPESHFIRLVQDEANPTIFTLALRERAIHETHGEALRAAHPVCVMTAAEMQIQSYRMWQEPTQSERDALHNAPQWFTDLRGALTSAGIDALKDHPALAWANGAQGGIVTEPYSEKADGRWAQKSSEYGSSGTVYENGHWWFGLTIEFKDRRDAQLFSMSFSDQAVVNDMPTESILSPA